ncbi:hypothetical protein ACPOL_2120 [Acidisarcina polymorpha]|uniref:Uncharacterized protein n=1 Tax=Acidisarcina polymorpha TaxID=2211140 RepID=A0A2Z5FY52_9BACT|nr:hypothetical protein ACPOL_2120 [Acidisarcina polymorpha]
MRELRFDSLSLGKKLPSLLAPACWNQEGVAYWRYKLANSLRVTE